jgi:hypothetical protein
MVIYTCPKCSKEFNRKCNFMDHIENKKKPCKPIHTENTQNHTGPTQNHTESTQNIKIEEDSTKDNSCLFCGLIFTRKDALKRHIDKYCKVKKLEKEKKENILNSLIEKEKINNLFNMYDELKKDNEEIKKSNEEKNKIIEELNKKNNELNKKIEDVLKKNNGNTQNINTTNNIQIINNITKINPFGKESFDKLDRKDILKIMTDTKNNGKHCFNKLIDLVHFNASIPENQNVYMGDYNRGKFMVHDGKDWNLSQNEELIIFQVLEHVRKLYFSKIDDEEFEKKFEQDQVFRSQFNTTFKKYYDYIYDEVDDVYLSSQELKKKNDFKELMNNEVKNKLYNKRKFVTNTYEKNKENLLT